MDLMEVVGGLAPGGVSLEESWVDPGFYDPDIDLTSEQGGALYYRRLTQSPADLQPMVHERMQAIAAHLYDRNPVARRAMNIIRDHVVGEGFGISSKDEDTEAVLRKVWDDGTNDMALRIHDMTLELGLFGEQAVAAFVHSQSGHVVYAHIDPRTIRQVLYVPGRPDMPFAISVVGDESVATARWIKVIQPGPDGLLHGAGPGDMVRPTRDSDPIPYWQPEGLDASTQLAGCFFWPINKTRGARRGRSDLLPVMDFVDLYDKLVFDDAERMSFMRAFVWDVEIKNATAEELKNRAATEPAPRPGTVLYRNENEKWAALSPDLKAADGATTADLVLSLIATGVGVSKTWLNGAMDVNRATAGSMDEPTRKTLRSRQRYVAAMVEQMATFAVHSAVHAGALPAPDADTKITVATPEMYSRDLQRGSGALFSSVQALGMAKAAGWMDPETPLEVLANMLAEVGVNIEASELKDRIEKAREEGQNGQVQGQAGEIPSYLGVGSQFGSDALGKAVGGGAQGTGAVPPKDAAAIASQIASSLVSLGQSSVVDVEVAQDIFAQLMKPLGITIDLEAMRRRLEAEEEESQQQALDSEIAGVQAAINMQKADEEEGGSDVKEAFDESKVKRGEGDKGGQFTTKGPSLAEKMKAAGFSSLTEYMDSLKEKKAAGGKGSKTAGGKAKGGGGEGGGGKGKGEGSGPKPLSAQETKRQVRALKEGDLVSITVDGQTVDGMVDRAASGMVMVKTPTGYVAVHDRMTNISGIRVDGNEPNAGRVKE